MADEKAEITDGKEQIIELLTDIAGAEAAEAIMADYASVHTKARTLQAPASNVAQRKGIETVLGHLGVTEELIKAARKQIVPHKVREKAEKAEKAAAPADEGEGGVEDEDAAPEKGARKKRSK
jgi:hypothetical protein